MEKQTDKFQKLLFTLVKRLKADYEHRLAASKTGITTLQYGVLCCVDTGLDADRTLNSVAEKMVIKPPTVIPAIDSLEKKGYLVRQPDMKDRRKIQLMVTRKGHSLLKKVNLKGNAILLSGVLKKLGAKKSKQLINLMEETVAYL